MTNERETLDMTLAAQFHRLRELALQEAEVCLKNDLPSGWNRAYGAADAYATAIRIVSKR